MFLIHFFYASSKLIVFVIIYKNTDTFILISSNFHHVVGTRSSQDSAQDCKQINFMKTIYNIYINIISSFLSQVNKKESEVFREPVDWKKLGIPGKIYILKYYQLVAHRNNIYATRLSSHYQETHGLINCAEKIGLKRISEAG